MRAIKALVLILFFFAIFATICMAQNDSNNVVNAIEIMKDIQNGTPVYYEDKIIKGNLSIADWNLPTQSEERDPYGIAWGLSEELNMVYSEIEIKNCSIIGNVDFSNTIFLEPVSIINSKLSASSNFRGSIFNQSANFSKTQFIQSADFWWSQFVSWSDFWGAQFDENADFEFAQFNSETLFNSSRFGKDAIFDYSNLSDSASFDYSAISGDLSMYSANIEYLTLNKARIRELTLRSWKDIGNMEYDEAAYQLILNYFRNQNLLDDANECYYDYRNGRRATLWRPFRCIDLVLDKFYGYGVKPERPVVWAFFFWVFFALLFWWRQGIMPVREGEPEEEANRFTLPEAIAFSAMTLLSGGKLVFDPPDYRIAPEKPWRDIQVCKALFILERLMGMTLLFMLAIAVTKTIILGS